MKFNHTKKIVVGLLIGAGAAVLGVAGAAYLSTGTGSGNAQALSAVNITVTAATGDADLYPGFDAGDVYFTSANTNPYDVTFVSMTPGAVTSSDPVNCPANSISVDGATGLALVVPAGATAEAGSVADVVSMDIDAPDECQGVVFNIGLTLTGAQS